MKKRNLKVKPEKCEVIYFNKTRKEPKDKVKIDNVVKEYAKQTKYLGVTITKGLNFSSHINDKIAKAHKKLWMFKLAIAKTWGPRPKLLLYMYKQIILPGILYACFAWAHLINLTQDKKFHRLNSLAMRLVAPIH